MVTHIDGLIGGFHQPIYLVFAQASFLLAAAVAVLAEETLGRALSHVNVADIIVREHRQVID